MLEFFFELPDKDNEIFPILAAEFRFHSNLIEAYRWIIGLTQI